MKRSIVATLIWLFAIVTTVLASPQKFGQIDFAMAANYFAEFEDACTKDGGKLWGVSVCGPVLLVDPKTRNVAANRADKKGWLEARDGVFVGKLPAKKPIANAPVSWAGVRRAMVVVQFLEEDEASRVRLLAHESFHRVQPKLGLMAFAKQNDHLETADGRYWMQLEWNALQEALVSYWLALVASSLGDAPVDDYEACRLFGIGRWSVRPTAW